MPDFVQFISPKGGQGCTAVATMTALGWDEPTLLVDAAGGDAFGASGVKVPDDDDVAPVQYNDSHWLVKLGVEQSGAELWSQLQHPSLDMHHYVQHVVIDRGTNDPLPDVRTYMVLQPCYLALRHAVLLKRAIDGFILMGQHDRALGASDVERVLGAPCVTTVPWDAAIARAIDAGLIGRMKRPMPKLSLVRDA